MSADQTTCTCPHPDTWWRDTANACELCREKVAYCNAVGMADSLGDE